jgi:hypothetical protein
MRRTLVVHTRLAGHMTRVDAARAGRNVSMTLKHLVSLV